MTIQEANTFVAKASHSMFMDESLSIHIYAIVIESSIFRMRVPYENWVVLLAADLRFKMVKIEI